MTLIRLGYVAMSMHVKNCSPSQTMTFSQFSKIKNIEAAVEKLERIANSNLRNCLRLLRHNQVHDISFFRLSSKLIPLVNHPEIPEWNYMNPLMDELREIRSFLEEHPETRVDFHPDHFVLLNSEDKNVLMSAVKTLKMHRLLLKGMGIDPEHRCVLHVGGGYNNHEKALEQFIHNWGLISERLQEMVILENDDTTFSLSETLYLCEKLGIPMAFDYHHFLAHHNEDERWEDQWGRVIGTWSHSRLPPKMHISSPRSPSQFRAHAEYVDSSMFMDFLRKIKGSVPQLDCMIEAKQKDGALFHLMKDLENYEEVEIVDGGSFLIK
ncbi:UV DNA damage repair endonuclease UvsE [Bacillus sp. MUM 13]|uniref:UV DNA damage repair endonuclease UvsE n=1 Tax=Bacillus sp. MUM 13 TaxID=1678001 RepID=UPI0008F5C852|nr:UV DNA damage repair endonuclease UvsE [Bacillus sp. MUM 13]OIK13441.1 UV damage endonuclease UvsE [Bacillus sp. MUM 13]